MQQEKRRSPRVGADPGSRGHLKATVPVTVLNVSRTGLLLELAATLRPGSTYDLTGVVSGVTLAVLVRITRCRAGGYMEDGAGGRVLQFHAGAEFVNLQPKQVEEIARAVERSATAGDSQTRLSLPPGPRTKPN